MKSITLFILLTFISVTIFSCISAEKAYSEGDYYKAFDKSLSKLDKESKVKEHKRILINSLNNIIRKTEKLAQDGLQKETDIKVYKSVQKSIKNTLQLIHKAEVYISDKFEPEKVDLNRHLDEYQYRIAEYHYNKGIMEYQAAINNSSKKEYQKAYYNFIQAEKYYDEFPNISELKDTCLVKGTYHIRVNSEATFEIMHRWDIERKFDDITSYSNTFRKVYFENSPTELDCIITVDLRSLDVDDTEDSRTERHTKQIQDGYTTKTDTAGNTIETPKYIDIEGTVKIITAKRTARWTVDISVDKESKHCNYSGMNFVETEVATVEIYELDGDKRAIPSQYDDSFPDKLPDEDDMADILIDRIYDRFVREYF